MESYVHHVKSHGSHGYGQECDENTGFTVLETITVHLAMSYMHYLASQLDAREIICMSHAYM